VPQAVDLPATVSAVEVHMTISQDGATLSRVWTVAVGGMR